MIDENDSIGGDTEQPPKKLNLKIFLKPVADVNTSIGRIFLFPLKVSDAGEYEKLSMQAPVERIREFLPCIASLSDDQERGKITAGQIEKLSDQEVEELAERYVSSRALRHAPEEGGTLVRGVDEVATAFMDRFFRNEVEEQANLTRKFNEQIFGSTRGIFDKVRKNSLELGETWRKFESLTNAITLPRGITPTAKSIEFQNPLAEHHTRLAQERAEDREMTRLTGQMSAQSAKTLQELADSASTMLERLDERDENAKRTTNIQLWIAAVSMVISALLAGAAFFQDHLNNESDNRWQADFLSEIQASNKLGVSLEAENKLLRDRVGKLSATITVLENKVSTYAQGPVQASIDKRDP